MLTASTFAFHVTYTCPLECAHCCFVSGPNVRDKLEPSFILEAIRSVPKSVRLIAFTGGEPFLHGANLVRYVAAAKFEGFATRIVTSAYFGRSLPAALKRIQAVRDAGLDELSISWDDFHEQFLSFQHVLNVVEAAVSLGLRPAINCVQVRDSKWTKQRIISELGIFRESVTVIVESQLNLTGRAEQALSAEPMKANGFLGPCPYVLTGPTMSAKGKLLACCGVIPDTKRLTIADNVEPSNIEFLVKESFRNALFQ